LVGRPIFTSVNVNVVFSFEKTYLYAEEAVRLSEMKVMTTLPSLSSQEWAKYPEADPFAKKVKVWLIT
jgi:hypothetical protein